MPIKNIKRGENVKIPYPRLVNLYECQIGDNCFIGPFVEIQRNVKIGAGSRIQSHTFICSKVTIGKNVFVGHGVTFINDRYPVHQNPEEWDETIVEDEAVIGNNATILPVKIEQKALIGAGAVVIEDVAANTIVAGNPAKTLGERK